MTEAKPDDPSAPRSGPPSGATLGMSQTGFSLHGLSLTPAEQAAGGKVLGPLPPEIGGFRFVRELGRGGMGVVYEAEEIASARRVALKVIAPRIGVSQSSRERFEHEARLAASISHPHCVFVFGAHQLGDQTAIAMELMSGRSLDDAIKSGARVSVEQAVRWIIEACEGLAAAHAAGIIHRDIKPSNCFLTDDDRVKLGDFGLSLALAGDPSSAQSGGFAGTPYYASPEQIRGGEIDQRTDVYSLGATLFAVLAGKAPFPGSSLGDVAARVASEPPPPLRTVRPDVPRALERVIQRALAKNPADRFPTAAAFHQALAEFAPATIKPARGVQRIVAYAIDSVVIRVAATGIEVVWFLILWLLGGKQPAKTGFGLDGTLAAVVLLHLAALIYFSIFEGLFGTTFGKRIMGLRIVDLPGRLATGWRTLSRAAIFRAALLLPALFMSSLPVASKNGKVKVQIDPEGNVALGVAVILITMRRSNGLRGLHDFLTGTRVVAAVRGRSRVLITSAFDPAPVARAGLPAMVGSYAVTGWACDVGDGALLLGRDPRLDRQVWILRRPRDARALATTPAVSPGAQVRFIETLPGEPAYDVFESPGGASLSAWRAARDATWHATARMLVALCDETIATGSCPDPRRLWVDRGGRLRIADFAVNDPAAAPAPSGNQIVDLMTASRLVLCRNVRGRDQLPADLPDRASPVVRMLLGERGVITGLAELRDTLLACIDHPTIISRKRRCWAMLPGIAYTLIASFTAVADVGTNIEVGVKTEDTIWLKWALLVTALLLAQLPRIGGAFFFRGGFGMNLGGIRASRLDGRPAGRWRCAFRALICHAPLLLGYVGALLVMRFKAEWLAWAGLAATGLAYAVGIAWSVRNPTRGWQDQIAGTRLVRR